MSTKIQTLNIRLPKEVIIWIDSLVEEQIYSNRSEAVRDFIRGHIKKSLR